MTVETIDVCVCTFRRASLRRTLESIAEQRLPDSVRIRVIVADNDVAPERRATILADAAALHLDCVYVHAPAHNISIARNACLDTAGADWIAFIDDDEHAARDWLARLLAARDGLTVVFGISQALYSDSAIPAWAQRGDFHSNRIAGNDSPWNGYTANVLIDRAFLMRNALRFDPEFGETGGEDTDLFLRMHRAGAVFGYCPEAVVYEETPPSRATLGWLLKRRYRAGQVHHRLHASDARSSATMAGGAAVKAAALFVGSLTAATSRHRAIERLLRGALHVGVIGSAIGLGRYREYRTASAEPNAKP